MPTSLKNHAVLLLSCPDKKGIVASVANFIFKNNGNIVHAEQYTDTEKDMFFMRIEWQLEDFKIPRAEIPNAFAPIAKQFNMKWTLHFMDHIPNMAIFVSKSDHCLYEILLRYKAGELPAKIPLIISNHPDLRQVAENFDIKYYVFPITPENKHFVEQQELKLLRQYCTLTLFCRLPSLNLEKMGKIGEKVPIPSSNVVPRNVKKYLTKRFWCDI